MGIPKSDGYIIIILPEIVASWGVYTRKYIPCSIHQNGLPIIYIWPICVIFSDLEALNFFWGVNTSDPHPIRR